MLADVEGLPKQTDIDLDVLCDAQSRRLRRAGVGGPWVDATENTMEKPGCVLSMKGMESSRRYVDRANLFVPRGTERSRARWCGRTERGRCANTKGERRQRHSNLCISTAPLDGCDIHLWL